MIAYRRAATRIRETPGSVAQLALDGAAKDLPGIGKTIEEKIVQIVDDGEMHALTKRKAMVPPEVVSFMRLPGLGPKSAAKIWKSSGSRRSPTSRTAAEAEQLRTLSGFGARRSDPARALAGSDTRPGPAAARRGTLAVLAVVDLLRAHPPPISSRRRGASAGARRRFATST